MTFDAINRCQSSMACRAEKILISASKMQILQGLLTGVTDEARLVIMFSIVIRVGITGFDRSIASMASIGELFDQATRTVQRLISICKCRVDQRRLADRAIKTSLMPCLVLKSSPLASFLRSVASNRSDSLPASRCRSSLDICDTVWNISHRSTPGRRRNHLR